MSAENCAQEPLTLPSPQRGEGEQRQPLTLPFPAGRSAAPRGEGGRAPLSLEGKGAGGEGAKPLSLSRDEGDDFARAAAAASGADILVCLQCRKCTCGCPVAGRVDIRPHELVRLVQLGARDEVLGSRLLWECTSCETCVTRCPQSVDIPALVDALRRMSRAERKTAADTVVPVFNDVFLRTVRLLGRTYEAGLMASFKARTMRLFEDLGKVPLMLRKGKLALVPKYVRGGAERRRLFSRARTAERRAP